MDRFPKTTRVLLAALLLLVLQGPMALLQLTAWGGMLVDHSRQGSVLVAIEKTFNGENPCQLCLTIQEMQTTQSSAALADTQNRSILLLLGQTKPIRCHRPSQQNNLWPCETIIPDRKVTRVATPPPKSAPLAAA